MNDLPSNAEPGPDNVLDKMVEHFTARIRSGETPSISEYQARCPELGSEIHELLSSAAMIEGLKKQTNALLTSGPGRFEDLFELERLGEYRIVRELGRGGMGIVLEAVHESLGRRVAIKVLPHRLVSNEKHVERFTREARAAATLHHTNIVSVFGVGHSDGYYYYVMEYIDGCGLDQIMRGMRASSNREPDATLVDGTVSMEAGEPTRISHDEFQLNSPPAPMDPDRFAKLPQGPKRFEWAARIVAAIADALEYAHGQGVLHRDIKPGNLLLDPTGRVWLTDFGLVKNLANPSMTMAGDVIGTPQYMAPESFEGHYHVSSETYCLGVTLYELVTLQPVCREGSAAEMIRRVTSETIRKPRQVDDRIPRDLATIIEKSIAREPANRYQTADGMHRDLNAFLNNHPISARPASIPKRVWLWSRRNPWQAISAGLVGLVAILATAGFVSRSGSLNALSSQHKLLIEERDNTRKARDIALEQFERAEANVDLSLELFDEMFKRMVTLGTGQRDGFSFDGFRELTGIETAISEKDAEYLESMLSFIGRFADENSENTEFAAKAAKSFRRVANIYHLLGKYPEARDAYRSSIRKYELLLASSPDLSTTIDQAQTANELGLLTLGNGDYRNASKVFTKIRETLETCSFKDELPVKLELIRTLNLMGSSAPIVSTEALIRDRDATADASTPPRQRRRGIGYRNRVSRQYRQMGKANEVFVREAISLVNQLIAEHGESPDLLLERARSLVRLAELQYWLHDKQGSLHSKESAVVDLAHLTDELPDSPEYRALLAQVYAMPIGQSNEDSLEELLKASDITTVLCEDFPGNTDYLQMDAEVNYQLSQLRRDLGAPDLAIEHLRASHEALLQVSQRAPRNVPIRMRYYAVAMELAESMFEQKRFVETRDFLLDSIKGAPRSGNPRGTPVAGNRSIAAQQHRLLARCYDQLGEKAAARRANRKAQQIAQAQRDKAQRDKAQREKTRKDGKDK